jgi:hypothetical protein
MTLLKRRYTVFSFAAQLNIWGNFIKISCDKSTPAAGLATTIRNKLLDLCETGMELNENTFCGIVLQNGMAQGTDLQQEFDLWIDQ